MLDIFFFFWLSSFGSIQSFSTIMRPSSDHPSLLSWLWWSHHMFSYSKWAIISLCLFMSIWVACCWFINKIKCQSKLYNFQAKKYWPLLFSVSPVPSSGVFLSHWHFEQETWIPGMKERVTHWTRRPNHPKGLQDSVDVVSHGAVYVVAAAELQVVVFLSWLDPGMLLLPSLFVFPVLVSDALFLPLPAGPSSASVVPGGTAACPPCLLLVF